MSDDENVAGALLVLGLVHDSPVVVVADVLDEAIQTLRDLIRAP